MTTNFKTIFIVFRFEHSFFTIIIFIYFFKHAIFLLMFHPLLLLHETIFKIYMVNLSINMCKFTPCASLDIHKSKLFASPNVPPRQVRYLYFLFSQSYFVALLVNIIFKNGKYYVDVMKHQSFQPYAFNNVNVHMVKFITKKQMYSKNYFC
jgi:hypothetical protein